MQDFLSSLSPTQVSQVLLTGDFSASDPTLHELIMDVLLRIDKANLVRKSPNDYVFAAARGAASKARLSMLDGGDLCMPDRSCELADGHPWRQGREL